MEQQLVALHAEMEQLRQKEIADELTNSSSLAALQAELAQLSQKGIPDELTNSAAHLQELQAQ